MNGLPPDTAPVPQKNNLRRRSFFFFYLLLLPLLLQLIFGAFSFSLTEWGNWSAAFLFRSVSGGVLLWAALKFPSRLQKLFLWLLTLGAGLFNLLDLFLLFHFGTTFDWSVWQLIKIAPAHEVTGFCKLFLLRFTTLGILLIYPVAGALIFTVKKRKILWLSGTLFTGGVLLFFNCFAPETTILPRNPGKELKKMLHSWQSRKLHRNLEEAARKVKSAPVTGEALHLLVIGESHSRRRSSLYGFEKETTPMLKKLFLEKQLFRFDNAVTPHVMTHLVLPHLLTFAPLQTKDFSRAPAVADVFRQAGFKVFYIYNQTPDTEDALPFLAAAKRSDVFVSLSGSRRQFDEKAVDLVRHFLTDPAEKKLIILHLLGNHWEYGKTFPPDKALFKVSPKASPKEKIINDYDNSLRCLDQNLFRLITLLAKENKESVFLYLSDHGEALYEREDFAGHTDLFPTASTAEIPFVIWLSEKARTPSRVKQLTAARKRPFFSADLPHLLTELAQIKTNLFLPERSVINDTYKAPRRPVSTRQLNYDELPDRTHPTSEP